MEDVEAQGRDEAIAALSGKVSLGIFVHFQHVLLDKSSPKWSFLH